MRPEILRVPSKRAKTVSNILRDWNLTFKKIGCEGGEDLMQVDLPLGYFSEKHIKFLSSVIDDHLDEILIGFPVMLHVDLRDVYDLTEFVERYEISNRLVGQSRKTSIKADGKIKIEVVCNTERKLVKIKQFLAESTGSIRYKQHAWEQHELDEEHIHEAEDSREERPSLEKFKIQEILQAKGNRNL